MMHSPSLPIKKNIYKTVNYCTSKVFHDDPPPHKKEINNNENKSFKKTSTTTTKWSQPNEQAVRLIASVQDRWLRSFRSHIRTQTTLHPIYIDESDTGPTSERMKNCIIKNRQIFDHRSFLGVGLAMWLGCNTHGNTTKPNSARRQTDRFFTIGLM